MIATALFFVLGFLAATLIALLLAPVVWRKAERLALRRYRATIPNSANEIRAEFDRVRAEAAMAVRIAEIEAARAREDSARRFAEAGRQIVENAELSRTLGQMREAASVQEAALAQALKGVSNSDEAQRRMSADIAGKNAEIAALEQRFEVLSELAEERQIQIIALEARVDGGADTLRSSERSARGLNETIAALSAGIADRDAEIARLNALAQTNVAASPLPAPGLSPTSAETMPAALPRAVRVPRGPASPEARAEVADLRERIADIAARVIRVTAIAEGKDSPLAPLLSQEPPDETGEEETSSVSLAERVRRLGRDDAAVPKAARRS